MLTLEALNAMSREEFVAALEGIYEHSPWIAGEAWPRRPFATLAHLKRALAESVREGGEERQLALVRAHPELAGKAMVAGTLTAESTHEQTTSGLTHCSPEEFDRLKALNTAYNAKFGFPFMLAVRGPRGTGLTRQQIIEAFARRLDAHPADEFAEALRTVHRIAEIRLADRFGQWPVLGNQLWDAAELLARHSDPVFAEAGQLTVTYLTEAHQACQRQLVAWMEECGFDEASVDAVGNVVGVYHGADRTMKRLMTGSHFDTVRDGGKYDGRLGILVPMIAVRELHRAGRRLPFDLEVIGFAEEEGQRYKATFLGSGAVIGQFDQRWLEQRDAEGITMREAMAAAGLDPARIPAMARDPSRYRGFVEVHIEQGPVLHELDLPLGIVTSINGSVRYVGEVVGTASHAGTTPMDRRRDAATAVAELALFVEKRAAGQPHLVGTVGILNVPDGSINVVPGRCAFSLDLRATNDEARDALASDVCEALADICVRRGLGFTLEETVRASAAPSDPAWQQRWERAVETLGLPVHRMPSGAGHDAMKLHEVMPQAMLFVRGQNGGISHNPLESTTSEDADLGVKAFQALLERLAEEAA